MKRLLFFAVLFTISLGSFSQEVITSNGKPVQPRPQYNKCMLGIGNYSEKEIVFEPTVTYNWAFNNIENDADKLVLKKLVEALAPYNFKVIKESLSGDLLVFSVTVSKQLTIAQLKSAADQINVRIKIKDFTTVVSSGNKPVPEAAK